MMNFLNSSLKALLILPLFFFVACSDSGKVDGVLDESAVLELIDEKFHGLGDLQEAISKFYVSVIIKDWSSVYRFRNESIKLLANEESFIATMNQGKV